ncbi:MAG: hypothetical protein AAFR53_11435, partial [Pseudomonadota bacterium]
GFCHRGERCHSGRVHAAQLVAYDRVRHERPVEPWHDVRLALAASRFGVSKLSRLVFGYGYKPIRALWTVAGIVALTALLYAQVYATGQMAPNSDVVLTSADWLAAMRVHEAAGLQPLHVWTGVAEGYDPAPSYEDYETFSAFLYAVDLFVPLDAIGQETAWAPSKERGIWGAVGYWARLPIQISGWVITAVGAAVLTGLVGRDKD